MDMNEETTGTEPTKAPTAPQTGGAPDAAPAPAMPSGGTPAPKKKRSGLMWAVAIIVLALIGWGIYAFVSGGSSKSGNDAMQNDGGRKSTMTSDQNFTVGLSLASLSQSRWRTEREIITQKIEAAGGTVITTVADQDAAQQELQVRNLLLQGVDALIIVAQDGDLAGKLVDLAHEQNVPVIAYDRLIRNSDLDYYLSFDNVKVGEQQALGVLSAVNSGKFAYVGGSPTDNNAHLVREGSFNVLQPYIDSGDIQIVFDKNIDSWNRDQAYEAISAFLKNGGTLDAAVVANDGMAGGVIQALAENGLAGKVPVSGQDGDLDALHRIIQGTQTMTVYKPITKLAEEASKMAIALAKGEKVETDSVVNNGTVDVPSRLLDVVRLNASNIKDTVIADGIYTEAQVFGN